MGTTLKEKNQEYIPQKWENPSCPFCGSNQFHEYEKFGPDHRYTYVQCTHCSLVYLNPRPLYDQSFLDTAYNCYASENYHVQNPGQFNQAEQKVIEDYKSLVKLIEKLLGRKGRILDIGCATGLFLLAAKQLGWDCFGVDISAPMVTHMKEHFHIPGLAGQYHELEQLKNEKFDVIYSSHVIEHIPNPNIWMEHFKHNLTDTGIVFLQVPNQYSPERRLQRLLKVVGAKKDQWEKWRTPDHLYEPHKKSLHYLVAKHGGSIFFEETYSRKDIINEQLSSKVRHQLLQIGNNIRVAFRFH